MALQTLPSPIIYPGLTEIVAATPTFGADCAMTSVGHYCAVMHRAPKAMTITHVGFNPQAATGSPTATITIEVVDQATGVPTGTLWNAAGGGSTVTTGTITAGTWVLAALAAGATLAAGDIFAVKIAMASGSTLSTAKLSSYGQVYLAPYQINNTGSATKIGTSRAAIAIGTSSTVFVPFRNLIPVQAAATANPFNNTSSAKRGLRFQVPFKCRVAGVRIFPTTAAGDFNVSVMNDAGTDLGSTSIFVDKDQVLSSNGTSMFHIFFTNPAVLSPGTWYRTALEPTTSTNSNVPYLTLPAAEYRSALLGGTNYYYTALASGTWDDSLTTQVPLWDLLLDQLDDGVQVGGGMLVDPGLTGGVQG